MTAWNSNEDGQKCDREMFEYFHLSAISRPVPPPCLPTLGLWVNENPADRAAGVAVFSGLIQVSVRARKLRESAVA